MRGISFKMLPWLLLLSACATHQTPGIKVEYVDKPVIVQKSCLEPKDIPTRPARLGSPPANLETALAVVMAKVSEWTRYGNRADPALQSCAK